MSASAEGEDAAGRLLTRAGAGESLVVLRDRLVFQGRAGAFALAEVEVAPFGEVPLHAHPGPEIIRVLEGELEFATAEPGSAAATLATMGPGDAVSLPGNLPHSYRNPGARPVRMLALFDADLEAFFRAAATPGGAIPRTPPSAEEIGRVMAAAARHSVAILGPHGGSPA